MDKRGKKMMRKRLRKLFANALCVAILVSDIGMPDGMRAFAAESESRQEIIMDTDTDINASYGGTDEEHLGEYGIESSENDKNTESSSEGNESTEKLSGIGENTEPSSESSKSVEISAENKEETHSIGFADEDIAHGTYEYITWVIDAEGKLTVSGTGEFSASTGYYRAPWNFYSEKIISAEVNVRDIVDASYMFCDCSNLTSLDISGLDTSNVTDMSGMFEGCYSLASLDISGLDTSNVTDMSDMFEGCYSLASLDVSGLDTSNVTDMSGMFGACRGLTSLDTSGLDTSSVTDMSWMFSCCSGLTSLNVSGFDTSNVQDMSYMFNDCSCLISIDISFDMSNMPSTGGMFCLCNNITSIKIFRNLPQTGQINLPVARMCDENDNIYEYFPVNQPEGIWLYADADRTVLNSGNESGVEWKIENGVLTISGEKIEGEKNPNPEYWCSRVRSGAATKAVVTAKNVESTVRWFAGCSELTDIDVSNFDTSNVTDMEYMFSSCSGLTSLDVSGLDTSKVRDMSCMFSGCSGLISLDLRGFDTSNVTNMRYMFNGCSGLTSLDLRGFDTSNVTNMSYMFGGCSGLSSLDIIGFDTSSVTDMQGMFYGCSCLSSLNVSKFDTSKVTDMCIMFNDCCSLISLDVGNFNMSSMPDTEGMFEGCSNIKVIKTFPNLEIGLEYELPLPQMYDVDGNTYEYFPTGLSEGITLYAERGGELETDPSEEPSENTSESSNSSESEGSGESEGSSESSNPDESKADIEFRDDDIAHGTYEDIIWVIDADGKLTVSGTGDFAELTNYNPDRAPWYEDRADIKSAEVNVSGMKNAAYMFYNCRRLTSLAVSGFDTSNVADMRYLFYGCSGLSSLDVSGFDTSNVTDMSHMFAECWNLSSLDVSGFNTSLVTDMNSMFGSDDDYWGCNSLTYIDVSGFDTSNVTDMSYMFAGCENLMGLDVSGFDTGNVTNMRGMFCDCWTLYSLDVSGFDTNKVTHMGAMFAGCENLRWLDVSGLDTSSVTSMGSMFSRCQNLVSLDVSGFDTSKVTYMRCMFKRCWSLYSLDISGFDTRNVTDMSEMFAGCEHLSSLDVSGFDTSKVTDMSEMFAACGELTSLDVSNFNTSSVTDMSSMFGYSSDPILSGCWKLTYIDVSNFDTSKVTGMGGMFNGCSRLTSLDLSGFDTSKVTDMGGMFRDCRGLISLDVSGFDTSKVTDMDAMFYGCSGLSSLDVSGFDTSKVWDMSRMFADCSSLTSLDVSGFDTSNMMLNTGMEHMFYGCGGIKLIKTFPNLSLEVELPAAMRDESGKMYEYFPTGLTEGFYLYWINSGSESGVTWEITEDDTLIIAGEKIEEEPNPTGETWRKHSANVKKVIVTAKNIASTANWFAGCTNITEIDMSGFDTSKVTDMSYMFNNCRNLSSLDISGLDTSSVTDMSYMFEWCSSLNSLNISGLDISKVTNMDSVFYKCSSLSSLNLSGLDTSSVTDMSYMFSGCSGLTSLDISGLDTSSVTDMSHMFSGCSGLASLDVSGLDTGKVMYMYRMFSDCSGLTSLDVSDLDTSNVMDMNYMFSGCSGLTSLDVSGLDTSNVMGMEYMFSGCSGLTSLDVRGLDTSNVMGMIHMFSGCSSLISLDVSGLDTSKVTYMDGMFSGCSGLTSLDVSGLDTSNVRRMECMFSGCSGLTSLDVSGLDTSNVWHMGSMFSGCSSLTSLDVGGLDTSNVSIMEYMFGGCSGIKTITTFPSLSQKLKLPLSKMYDEDGNTYRYFPTNLSESIVLYADKVVETDPSEEPSETESASESSESGSSSETDSANESEESVESESASESAESESSTESSSEPIGSVESEEGLVICFVDDTGRTVEPENYEATYNGAAIKPMVCVKHDGVILAEGVDYTVKYKNNTNAGNNTAIVTVNGKGNFTGVSEAIKFTIKPAVLGTDVSVPSAMTVALNTKIAPVLMCGARKLGAKDFEMSAGEADKAKYDSAKFKFTATGKYTLTVTAKGTNYTGEDKIEVNVVEKTALKKLKVTIDSQKAKSVIYDGNEHDPEKLIKEGIITVSDATTKTELMPESDGVDNYKIVCGSDTVNAGTVKFTIVGCGEYGGSVAKSYKINPVKSSDGFTITPKGEKKAEYKSSGARLDDGYEDGFFDITYKCGDKTLDLKQGTDYKVAYSGNKKVGTGKYTITFLGNYKGSKPADAKSTFEITPAKVYDGSNKNYDIVIPDKAYSNAGKAYKSAPIVTVNGEVVKNSNYTVDYKWASASDADDDTKYNNDNNKVKVTLSGEDAYAKVKVTVTFKSNSCYVKATDDGMNNGTDSKAANEIVGEYFVREVSGAVDLSKAKVTFYSDEKCTKQLKSLEYNGCGFYTPGEGNTSDAADMEKVEKVYVKVEVKGVDSQKLKGTYTVHWTNSTAKGKATVVINGTGEANADRITAVGSKNASISIKAKNIKNK